MFTRIRRVLIIAVAMSALAAPAALAAETTPADPPANAGAEKADNTADAPADKPEDAADAKARLDAERSSASEKERIAVLLQYAMDLYNKGDLVRAKDLLADIPPDSPYSDHVKTLSGAVDDQLARIDRQAEQALLSAEQAERDAYALYVAARRDYWKKRYDNTIEKCNRVLEAVPDHPKAKALLSDALMARAIQNVDDKNLNRKLSHQKVFADVNETATVPETPPAVARPEAPVFPNPRETDYGPLEEKLNQKISVNLENTPLEYLLDIIFRATGVSIITDPEIIADKSLTVHVEDITLGELLDYITRNFDLQISMSKNAMVIQSPEKPLLTYRIFPLKHGLSSIDAEDLGVEESSIDLLLEELPDLVDWPDGSHYYLDRKANVLYVRSSLEILKDVEAILNASDVEVPNILIETKFLEVSTDLFDDLGMEAHTTADWGVTKKNGGDNIVLRSGLGGTLPLELTSEDFPNAATSGLNAALAGMMTQPQFELVLHALRDRSDAHTLAEPKVLTLNNTPATIEISRDLYYVSGFKVDRSSVDGFSYGGASDSSATTTSTPSSISEPIPIPEIEQAEPIGFLLFITPSVGADRRNISLLIEPDITEKVDDLSVPTRVPLRYNADTGETEYETIPISRPVISRRTLTTKMVVHDGYWVMIGGLVNYTQTERITKVPLLGDVPLIKHLFRRKSMVDKKSNLLIFARAKVISPRGESYYDDSALSATNAPLQPSAADIEALLRRDRTD